MHTYYTSFLESVLLCLISVCFPVYCAPPYIFPDYTAKVTLTIANPATPPRIFSGIFYQSIESKASRLDLDNSAVVVMRYDAMMAFSIYGQSCGTSSTLLDFQPFFFIQAPGTIYNGTEEINGVQCDWYLQPIGNSNDGYALCLTFLQNVISEYNYKYNSLDGYVPVRYKVQLGSFLQQRDFWNFTSGELPPEIFGIPSECNFTGSTDLPFGLFEGFESGGISSFWLPPSGITYVSTSITVQSIVVRTGTFSANITVFPGDCREDGGFGKYTERDELDIPLLLLGESEVFYGFSMFLPSDFEITDTRLVLAQWKAGDLNSQSPIIAFRFISGEFYITVRNLSLHVSDNDEIKFPLPDVKLGVWNDFVFGILWSGGGYTNNTSCDNGYVAVWHNGTIFVNYSGPTSITCSTGSTFDHHIGLYRDHWETPWTIFLDNWGVGRSYKEVDPARFDHFLN